MFHELNHQGTQLSANTVLKNTYIHKLCCQQSLIGIIIWHNTTCFALLYIYIYSTSLFLMYLIYYVLTNMFQPLSRIQF